MAKKRVTKATWKMIDELYNQVEVKMYYSLRTSERMVKQNRWSEAKVADFAYEESCRRGVEVISFMFSADMIGEDLFSAINRDLHFYIREFLCKMAISDIEKQIGWS